jgi:sugar fermentation stimulation protein A
MKFIEALQPAIFVRRYKRFLVDVTLSDGTSLTVHCPNTGSMKGCLAPDCEVMLSVSGNPNRKYPHTLEMTRIEGTWIGVNTSRTNRLVREALEKQVVKELGPIETLTPEVVVSPGSRLDFLLHQGGRKTYLEVKNCTLVEQGIAMFPDAVTARGTRHLRELIALQGAGQGAVIFYCVQRKDGEVFAPAAHIDPLYAATLREAMDKGVKVLAYQAAVCPGKIEVCKSLPIDFLT